MIKKYIKPGWIFWSIFFLFTACDQPEVLIFDPIAEGSTFNKSLQFKIVQFEQQSELPDLFSATLRVQVPNSTTRSYKVDIEKDESGYYWVSQPVEAPLQRSFTLSMSTTVGGTDWIGYGSYIPEIHESRVVELYLYEASADFAGGSGTADDPYLVASADHLNNVRHFKNANFRQVANIDLGISPWSDDKGWQPVGYYRSGGHVDNRPPFTGEYNGDSFRIMNLTIQDSTLNTAALFGWTQEAVLQNVFMENVNIRGAWAVGALSGVNEKIFRIENCHSTGIIHGNEAVGGLIGTTGWPGYFDHASEGIVTTSSSHCTVNGSVAGGLAGWNLADLSTCSSSGAVTGKGTNIGGLSGVNAGTVTSCHASGNVSGKGNVGGLFGWNTTNNVTLSYATGDVNELSTEPWESGSAGGLIGRQGNGVISYCYAEGNVTAKTNAGGLIGTMEYTSGVFLVCVIRQSYATGDVTGYSTIAGGLAGANSGGTVENCYARGDVSVPDYAGGLIGHNGWDPSTVTRCYSAGKVTGNTNVGGLIGFNNNFPLTTDSYWDGPTSGQAESAGGEGRFTEDMTYPYSQNTYTGWDFDVVWEADVNGTENDGYPFLRFPE
jgi:hypothetical protein